jgi:hypothetical protein
MARNWENLYQKYQGKWVALKEDHVTPISSGETRQEARTAAEKLGYAHPFVVKMPSDLLVFAG